MARSRYYSARYRWEMSHLEPCFGWGVWRQSILNAHPHSTQRSAEELCDSNLWYSTGLSVATGKICGVWSMRY